jgi:tRNA(Leu) C34 or U34 (ribose-2'-O)-methylase TrmL
MIMDTEKQKFLGQSARKQLRMLACELRGVEELLPGQPAAAGEAFCRVRLLFEWVCASGQYASRLPRWGAAFSTLARMFGDGTGERAISAALDNLYYDIAERAELPIGEENFLVRTNDRAHPGGEPFPLALILDNIRSAFNCGSLIRSAEGFGAAGVCLTGITPGPENAKVAKTAMGAIHTLRIERHPSLAALIQEKKDTGHTIYALETAEGAAPLFSLKIAFPAAVVLGNEEYGLDEGALALADHIAEIPMFGCKNSFNVASSGGIFLYEARKQWQGG